MKFVRFNIFTAMDRHDAIYRVHEAISAASGWIVDQTFFSNIAMNINFELPSASLQQFQDCLHEEGLNAYIEGEIPGNLPLDVRASISLTFSHNEPDLKQEVPPFG